MGELFGGKNVPAKPITETKICSRCKIEKNRENDFHRCERVRDKRQNYCKQCSYLAMKKQRKAPKTYIEKASRRNLKDRV